jgi:3-oxoacyl-[acyl-carrier-protein] synthase I
VNSQPLAILSTGLVTSVGLTAASSCAAIRAKISNPTETRYIDTSGEFIMVHQVPLERPWRGRAKLARMAVLAVGECLAEIPPQDWSQIPLLLCVAERGRPGRVDGVDDELFVEIQQELATEFAEQSLIIPHGRVSIGTALMHARRLLAETPVPLVLIAATDGLLAWPTLSAYERGGRLLAGNNSNGFVAGEGAGAILIGPPGKNPQLVCTGLGFSTETATIDKEQPLRGDGLVHAIRAALADAGCQMNDLDFRIADLSGEQYYFKEAALALARVSRLHKEEFDVCHAAECIGEVGSVSGIAALILADVACRKAYAQGPRILFHASNDAGQRTAAVLHYYGT